ncbi:PREDICTED: serine/arginine repetitive matrix protein 4-like [Ceratosolen solmsi marchali]|uniref:Serine/arginine repetitive matrix protein 4-like n=1 Tax=Ceratosolen solmsi marchali TaxID=326594 RepID=A0AAJ6YRC0_9HYME|nr:PREDICTED: serine/arginine repetitive matrix protein 4-like [Ceratosolen solmsi marchali]
MGDEEIFKNNVGKTKLRQLSLVSKINLSENSSKYDINLCDDFKTANMFSQYFNIDNDSLNVANSDIISSKELSNSFLSDKSKDMKFSKKNDINLKETFSFFQLSSSSQSTSFSQSLTPLKNCPDTNSWPKIFLLQNNASNLVVKEDIKYSKPNEKELISPIQSSLVKSSSESELSRSQTPRLSRYIQNLNSNYKTRSRSISFSKKSRSISRSVSRNSGGVRKRSSSKSSTQTVTSSTRRSCNTYSCSSQSTTLSRRISSPASTNSSRSRSTSIPRRHGSPSFLDRRRITSARKRPIPYHRPTPSPLSSTSSTCRSNYSLWSPESYRSSRAPSCNSPYVIS